MKIISGIISIHHRVQTSWEIFRLTATKNMNLKCPHGMRWEKVSDQIRFWRVKSILGISISLPVSTFPEIIQHRLPLVVGIAVWKQNFFSETRRLDVTDQDGDSHDFAAYQSLFVNDALLCYCYLTCLIPCNSQLEINPLFLFCFLSFFSS